MKFVKFLFSRVFFINLIIAAVLSVAIIWGTLLVIDNYTNHGEEISVPDFSGLNLDEIQAFADSNDLKFAIIDSVYSDDKEKGSVIKQNPLPGFNVKKQRTIYLTTVAVLPEQKQMPDVKTLSKRQAMAVLESYGFKVGIINYVPSIFENAVQNQKINGQEILPGTLVNKGSVIDLDIGQGESNEKVRVPELSGMKKDSAKMTLNKFSLNLGFVSYDLSVLTEEDTLNARVYDQYPKPTKDKIFRKGEIVDIFLTMDSTKIEINEELQNLLNEEDSASLILDSIPD